MEIEVVTSYTYTYMEDTWEIYTTELAEILDSLEQDIILMEKEPDSRLINNIYRYIHTIKGNSAIVSFEPVRDFTHALEDYLEPMRNGEREITREVINILLRSSDWIRWAADNRDTLDLNADHGREEILTYIAGGAETAGILTEDEIPEGSPVGVPPALAGEESVDFGGGGRKKFFRMDARKMDQLLDLVGELVIAESQLKQIAGEIANPDLEESATRISRLVGDLRENTLKVRLVQVGDTFRKFERVVRDLGVEYGKKIRFEISGGETELDKNMIEKISDPLMHIIRNAVDHGIDFPESRRKQGKPETGIISLSSSYEMGYVDIVITDDGRGLSKKAIAEKAEAAGIMPMDRDLNDEEIIQLIFMPGFSTAREVTSVSGRGVGLDVVKKNIESLGGSVHVQSEEGVGTEFRLHLPLTTAIIEGYLVRIGDAGYILPSSYIAECIEIDAEKMRLKETSSYIDHRDKPLPLLSMRRLFGFNDEKDTIGLKSVVICDMDGSHVGLMVDTIIGQTQTVIKPLGYFFRDVSFLTGAAILGTGEIALVLDVRDITRGVF